MACQSYSNELLFKNHILNNARLNQKLFIISNDKFDATKLIPFVKFFQWKFNMKINNNFSAVKLGYNSNCMKLIFNFMNHLIRFTCTLPVHLSLPEHVTNN